MGCTILLTLNRGAELRPIQCKTSGNTETGGCLRGMKRTEPCESTTYGFTAMTANKLHVLVPHFVSVCLFTASVDHFRFLVTIIKSIKVKITCRREWILMTYSKAMLLFTNSWIFLILPMIQIWWVMRPYNKYYNPYPTAFPYGNVMVLHFYQQQESSTTKTVHKVINKGLKTYV